MHSFNPRPSHEGRRLTLTQPSRSGSFNPRPSHEGRQNDESLTVIDHEVSIHAPRMRGDGVLHRDRREGHRVSIHAPRMRGDLLPLPSRWAVRCFNPRPSHEGRHDGSIFHCNRYVVSIHAPRMRGDGNPYQERRGRDSFQSTPLA